MSLLRRALFKTINILIVHTIYYHPARKISFLYFFLYVYKLLGIIYFHSIFLNLAILITIPNRFLKIKFLFNLVIYIVVTKKFLSSRKERWQGTIDVLNEWRKYLIRNVFLITYKIDMKKMWQYKKTIVRQEMGQHNLIHSNHKISLFLIGIK